MWASYISLLQQQHRALEQLCGAPQWDDAKELLQQASALDGRVRQAREKALEQPPTGGEDDTAFNWRRRLIRLYSRARLRALEENWLDLLDHPLLAHHLHVSFFPMVITRVCAMPHSCQ